MGKLVISNETAASSSAAAATTTTTTVIPEPPIFVRPAPRSVRIRPDKCYLIVGGLRGLCASLAIYLTVMSRSGDRKVPPKIRDDIYALGCDLQVCQGDVSREEDVRPVFRGTKAPVAGIVQGAMALRVSFLWLQKNACFAYLGERTAINFCNTIYQDRKFAAMTVEEYHDVLRCKVQGTWNLHTVSAELGLPLDFFTRLSSISGLCGSKGQANYAAANAFLDAFASYRAGTLGQPATSVDLGVIEDIVYMAEREELQHRYDRRVRHPINERLLRKIFGFSIMQQQQKDTRHHQAPINPIQRRADGHGDPSSSASIVAPPVRRPLLLTIRRRTRRKTWDRRAAAAARRNRPQHPRHPGHGASQGRAAGHPRRDGRRARTASTRWRRSSFATLSGRSWASRCRRSRWSTRRA